MVNITGRRAAFILGGIAVLGIAGWVSAQTLLDAAFIQGPTAGPFTADGICPAFRPAYPQCEIRFGNRGLSTLNSFYETFVGEGAFEIDGFTVDTLGEDRFVITADSNRGPITSQIFADRIVRIGQDQENAVVYRAHQSAFCDAGRIYEQQVVYRDGPQTVQDLEFWSENDALYFRLFQDGSPTAEVICR